MSEAPIPLKSISSPADADCSAGFGSRSCRGGLSPAWPAAGSVEPAGRQLLAGLGSPESRRCPIDMSASMSQPLGNGNSPYRGVALIKVYFK